MKNRKLMIYMLACLFILSICPALFASEYVPYWWKGKNFSGEVTAYNDSIIVVQNTDNQKRYFEINPQTKLFLRSTAKIEKGLYVKVVYKPTKQKAIAKAIREIRRPKEQH